jgi:hypothetical protein
MVLMHFKQSHGHLIIGCSHGRVARAQQKPRFDPHARYGRGYKFI